MAEPIQYQSPLPEFFKLLAGNTSKGTTTTAGTANVDPLMAVFQQALAGGQAGVPEMQALIESIFREGATKVPELTHAFANATGSRTTGNSALGLALGDLNRNLSSLAAKAILENQTNNRNIATQAAGGVAQATRGTTVTDSKRTNPNLKNQLLMLGAGFGLNKMEKAGGFEKVFGKMFGGGGGGVSLAETPATSPAGLNFTAPDYGMDYGQGETSAFFDGGGGLSPVVDVGSEVATSSPVNMDFHIPMGDIAPVGDVGFDFGTGAEFGNEDYGLFFADGGTVRNKNNMGARGSTGPTTRALNSAGPRPVSASQPRFRLDPRAETFTGDADTGGIGVTDSSNTGLTAQDTEGGVQGAVQGAVAQGLSMMGVPSAISSAAMSAISGVPSVSMSPIANLVQALVAAATGQSVPSSMPGNIGSLGDPDGFDPSADPSEGLSSGPQGTTDGLAVGPSGASPSGDTGIGEGVGVGIGTAAFADGGPIRNMNKKPKGYANGGMIKGAGTGTSDSIPINASAGEYVIPADVVRMIGTNQLDRLIAMSHRPVNR